MSAPWACGEDPVSCGMEINIQSLLPPPESVHVEEPRGTPDLCPHFMNEAQMVLPVRAELVSKLFCSFIHA